MQLSSATNTTITADQVLIDAPPLKREIEIEIDVFFPKEPRYRRLADVSPVVQTLAREQFDDYVKRVRVFVAPDVLETSRTVDLSTLLHDAIDQTD